MLYIKNEIKNISERNATLFEVKCELQAGDMRFFPSLEEITPFTLMSKFEQIISDIYTMSYIIPCTAQPPEEKRVDENQQIYLETYFSWVEMNSEIDLLKLEIYSTAKQTIQQAIEFHKKYKKYDYLWSIDRNTYLEQFLKYGRMLTDDEITGIANKEISVKEQFPNLENFKDQVCFV